MILQFTEMVNGELRPIYILASALHSVVNAKFGIDAAQSDRWARSIIMYAVGDQYVMSPVEETTEQVREQWESHIVESKAHPVGFARATRN